MVTFDNANIKYKALIIYSIILFSDLWCSHCFVWCFIYFISCFVNCLSCTFAISWLSCTFSMYILSEKWWSSLYCCDCLMLVCHFIVIIDVKSNCWKDVIQMDKFNRKTLMNVNIHLYHSSSNTKETDNNHSNKLKRNQ